MPPTTVANTYLASQPSYINPTILPSSKLPVCASIQAPRPPARPPAGTSICHPAASGRRRTQALCIWKQAGCQGKQRGEAHHRAGNAPPSLSRGGGWEGVYGSRRFWVSFCCFSAILVTPAMSPDSEADLAACRRPAMSCQPRSGQRSTQPLATHRSACHRLSMVRSRIRLPEWSLTSMKRGGRCRTWAPAKKAGTKRSNTSEYSPTPSGPCTEHTPLTHCLRRRTRTRQDQKAEIQSSGKFVKIEAGAVFMWLSGEGKDRRGWSDPATNCSSSRKSSSLPSVCAHEYDGIREIRASLRNVRATQRR